MEDVKDYIAYLRKVGYSIQEIGEMFAQQLNEQEAEEKALKEKEEEAKRQEEIKKAIEEEARIAAEEERKARDTEVRLAALDTVIDAMGLYFSHLDNKYSEKVVEKLEELDLEEIDETIYYWIDLWEMFGSL